MPRSRRRKGVKPHANRGNGKLMWDGGRQKQYYDPGVKPRAPNYAKQVARAQRPRRNARGK